MVQKVLFICSQNWHRSKTAETIFSKKKDVEVKSAGTNSFAETPLSKELLVWADIIFVMETHHKEYIMQAFSEAIKEKQIVVLDVADRYRYMDPVLIQILKSKVARFL